MNKMYPLLLFICTCFFGFAQEERILVFTELDYYTNEPEGRIHFVLPDDMKGRQFLAELQINRRVIATIETEFARHISIPFDLNLIPAGEHIVECFFNVDLRQSFLRRTPLRKLPHKTNSVKIDRRTGATIIDGMPWFPFGFYTYSPVQPTLAEEEAAKGFNMMSPYQNINGGNLADRLAYMDRCAELGMKVNYQLVSITGGGGVSSGNDSYNLDKVRSEIAAIKDHPALLSWYISDEPAGRDTPAEKLLAAYKLVKELDPYHPVNIVFVKAANAAKYSEAMDVVSADPYPIPNHPITRVSDDTRTLKQMYTFSKPVWIVPQAFGGSEWWAREPTNRELRVMTYMALINGATGIQYFIRHGLSAFPKASTTWGEAGAIAMEVQALTPFLLDYDNKPVVTTSDTSIQISAWRKDNQLTIMAVNSANKPLPFRFSLEDYRRTNGNLDLPFEDRQVSMRNGQGEDIIDAYGTRVYQIDLEEKMESLTILPANLVVDPSFEESPMPGVPAAVYARVGTDRGATFALDSRLAIHGDHSLRLHAPTAGSGYRISLHSIQLEPQKSYAFSIWGKAAKGNPAFTVKAGPHGERTFRLDTEWRLFQFVINSNGSTQKFNIDITVNDAGTAWFDLAQLVKDPVIRQQDDIYADKTRIEIFSANTGAEIFYTINNSDPRAYEGPFIVDKTSTIRVTTTDPSGTETTSTETVFVNIRQANSVEYKTPFSPTYRAGGIQGLIDGNLGSTNYTDGKWQGFEGKDVEFIIDYGEQFKPSQVATRFLQDNKNWIQAPSEVEFAISKKGKRCYRKIAKIRLPEFAASDAPQIRFVGKKAKKKKGRYLRVRIKANKVLPAGHPNAGEKAWLMMDEVLVE